MRCPGATILPEAGHRADVVLRAEAILERSLAQPWAGRRLPGLLGDRDVAEIDATPFSFAVNEPVWRRIVRDTLFAQADADDHRELSAWLDDERDEGLLAAPQTSSTVPERWSPDEPNLSAHPGVRSI